MLLNSLFGNKQGLGLVVPSQYPLLLLLLSPLPLFSFPELFMVRGGAQKLNHHEEQPPLLPLPTVSQACVQLWVCSVPVLPARRGWCCVWLWKTCTAKPSFLTEGKNQTTPLHPWKQTWGLSSWGWQTLCTGAVLASEAGLVLWPRVLENTLCAGTAHTGWPQQCFLAASHLPSWHSE